MVIINYSHYEMEGAVVDLAVVFPAIKFMKIYDILNIGKDDQRKLGTELDQCFGDMPLKGFKQRKFKTLEQYEPLNSPFLVELVLAFYLCNHLDLDHCGSFDMNIC